MNDAYRKAKYYVHDVNAMVQAFIARYGEPEDFAISGEQWRTTEEKIEEAIAENEWITAEDLCRKHVTRVAKYLNKLAVIAESEPERKAA